MCGVAVSSLHLELTNLDSTRVQLQLEESQLWDSAYARAKEGKNK